MQSTIYLVFFMLKNFISFNFNKNINLLFLAMLIFNIYNKFSRFFIIKFKYETLTTRVAFFFKIFEF